MERRELLERLVPLIPPPRAHQVRYHGVLAPCASTRDRIVPGPRPAWPADAPEAKESRLEATPARPGMRPSHSNARCRSGDSTPSPPGTAVPASRPASLPASAPALDGDPGTAGHSDAPRDAASGRPAPRRLSWAELLQRVFELDALRCPRCGARMRLLAAIEDPDVARRILACLDLPARAPPLGAVLPASVGDWKDGSHVSVETNSAIRASAPVLAGRSIRRRPFLACVAPPPSAS
jgi:hypothetical protein